MIGQEELDATLHPMPVLGSSGDQSLDLYISSAEQTYISCQTEIRQRKPLFRKGLDAQEMYSECASLISSAKGKSDKFIQAAQDEVARKIARVDSDFAYATSKLKPQATDEAIALRCHGLEIALDSLSTNKIIPWIETEMRNGDQLTRYILRDGSSGWIKYYLQSRNINMQEYYAVIGRTAGILETDLQRACEDLAKLPGWLEQISEMQQSLKNLWGDLTLELLSYPPKPLSVNSLESLPDDHVITLGDLRKYGTGGALSIAFGKR